MKQAGFEVESKLMKFFRKFHFESIAWSLRRVYCPVNKDALVLEVGSGSSPYFRANVLCDAHEDTQERFFAPLVHDRPIILAYGESLPFKDNAFDFVIASHVLEHSIDPERFLFEIQRVANAGYIEVPDAFMERLTHYEFHRLEITDGQGGLVIRKKKNFIHDQEVVELFHNKVSQIFPKWVARFPFQFHVRYYWSKDHGGIKYEIVNPNSNCSWDAPKLSPIIKKTDSLASKFKKKTLTLIRKIMSQSHRNRSIDLLSLLRCPKCFGIKHEFDALVKHAICMHCGSSHSIYMPTRI